MFISPWNGRLVLSTDTIDFKRYLCCVNTVMNRSSGISWRHSLHRMYYGYIALTRPSGIGWCYSLHTIYYAYIAMTRSSGIGWCYSLHTIYYAYIALTRSSGIGHCPHWLHTVCRGDTAMPRSSEISSDNYSTPNTLFTLCTYSCVNAKYHVVMN